MVAILRASLSACAPPSIEHALAASECVGSSAPYFLRARYERKPQNCCAKGPETAGLGANKRVGGEASKLKIRGKCHER
jgi:hypothetical protein